MRAWLCARTPSAGRQHGPTPPRCLGEACEPRGHSCDLRRKNRPLEARSYHAGKVVGAARRSTTDGGAALCLGVLTGREIGQTENTRHDAGHRMLREFAVIMSLGNTITPAKFSRPLSAKAREQQEALDQLRRYLRPGVTVWTVLRHVSASGLTRLLDLYVIEDNRPLRLTWSAATVLDWPYSRQKEALRVDGCGMDMGHHAVYYLSARVLGDSTALQQRWL